VEDSLHSARPTQTKNKYALVKGYNIASALGMHRSDICIGIGTDIEDISRSGIGDKWADPYLKKKIIIFFLRLCTYLNPIPTTLLL
jgi:hypothetical protein